MPLIKFKIIVYIYIYSSWRVRGGLLSLYEFLAKKGQERCRPLGSLAMLVSLDSQVRYCVFIYLIIYLFIYLFIDVLWNLRADKILQSL